MKTALFTAATLFLAILTSLADNCRYVTVTTTNISSPGIVQVQKTETAEILDCFYYASVRYAYNPLIQVGGVMTRGIGAVGSSASHGTTVAGPATITLDAGSLGNPYVLTVKITPSTYDVNKTLILPPGTNQVYVGLQYSTNLVDWLDATNGIYGSPNVAGFFRMRMSSLTSP